MANLSAQQLQSDELLHKLDWLMRRYKHPAPAVPSGGDRARHVGKHPEDAAGMAELGFLFALDDFGTSQSNLSLFLGNPYFCIKLDYSRIQEYPESRRAAFVVNTILKMFRAWTAR